MDYQFLFNIIFGITTSVCGWFGRSLWDAVNSLRADLSKLREELPKTYLAKDDFGEFRRELMAVLNRIESKLDSKVDK